MIQQTISHTVDWLEKNTEKYVGTDAKLSVRVNTTGTQISWLQFHMKHAAQIKAFLKSHETYKTIYFTSYVLNYNSDASAETRVESFLTKL